MKSIVKPDLVVGKKLITRINPQESRIYTILYVGKDILVVMNDIGQEISWNRRYTEAHFVHPIPPKKKQWLNIYPEASSIVIHETRKEADEYACCDRIACIKIEYYEGEGLESDG